MTINTDDTIEINKLYEDNKQRAIENTTHKQVTFSEETKAGKSRLGSDDDQDQRQQKLKKLCSLIIGTVATVIAPTSTSGFVFNNGGSIIPVGIHSDENHVNKFDELDYIIEENLNPFYENDLIQTKASMGLRQHLEFMNVLNDKFTLHCVVITLNPVLLTLNVSLFMSMRSFTIYSNCDIVVSS